MLVPGLKYNGNSIFCTVGAATVPDFFNQGFGFMNDGSLAIDTDTPAGNLYTAGIRQSAAGAIYAVLNGGASSSFNNGLGVASASQMKYAASEAPLSNIQNGMPLATNGRLITTTVAP